MKRVVITGLGTINSIARDADEYAESLRRGRCGIKKLSVFDPEGHMTDRAAEIPDLDAKALLGPDRPIKRLSRADVMGLAAAREALNRSGLWPVPADLGQKMGAGVGGGAGGLLAAEGMYRNYLNKGPDKVRFSRLAAVYCASTADWIAAWFGLGGPKTTFMTACSSGATAIGWGRDLIAAGLTPVMLAGGTEPICRMTHTAFNALRAVDPEYCKPFSKNRQGLTLGEGAAFMVLEDLDHALARGADILAEVLGYGLSADANHMTAPEPEGDGAVRAIEAALADAGLGPEAVDYVNAHGTGTPANDKTETKALRRVLGGRADQVPVSSTKSMIGHTLGAAGALEAAASVLAIRDRFVPPTIHLEEPDPECDLDYVSQGARDLAVDVVLSNSFAFGGNNTALLLGRHQPEERR